MLYNLERFVKAQDRNYEIALEEMRQGHKCSHWMWYIFPQIKGLGYSETARYYAIEDLGEAKAYMENELLRKRLLKISKTLLEIPSNDAEEVMGFPDNLKLQSSMTLFARACPEYDVFQKVLDKFYNGKMDERTLEQILE